MLVASKSQSGPGSSCNEGVAHIPKAEGLEPHHQMQFSVTSTG